MVLLLLQAQLFTELAQLRHSDSITLSFTDIRGKLTNKHGLISLHIWQQNGRMHYKPKSDVWVGLHVSCQYYDSPQFLECGACGGSASAARSAARRPHYKADTTPRAADSVPCWPLAAAARTLLTRDRVAGRADKWAATRVNDRRRFDAGRPSLSSPLSPGYLLGPSTWISAALAD